MWQPKELNASITENAVKLRREFGIVIVNQIALPDQKAMLHPKRADRLAV